jgi:hypothetical protein
MIFLIAYDRRVQRLIQPVESFDDGRRSESRRRRLEVELAMPPEEGRYEVVLLEAESLGVIEQTHARYFAANIRALVDDARDDVRDAERRFEKLKGRS